MRVDKDPVDPYASTAPASLSPLRKSRAGDPSSGERASQKGELGPENPPRDAPVAPSGTPPPLARGPARKAQTGRRGETAPLASVDRPTPQPSGSQRAGAPVAPPAGAMAGARVFVQWENGQKYSGVVEQIVGLQCLVRFDSGEQRWVESRYVLPA